MDGQPAPTCSACDCSLHGLPAAGRCPECGSVYGASAPVAYVGRPMFGWLLLIIPALVIPAAVSLALHLAFAPCCLVEFGVWGLLIGGPILGLVLAVLIALRLAEWRYGVACRAAPGRAPGETAFLVQTTIALTLVQVTAAIIAFIAFSAATPWLERVGLLPGK